MLQCNPIEIPLSPGNEAVPQEHARYLQGKILFISFISLGVICPKESIWTCTSDFVGTGLSGHRKVDWGHER